MSNLVLTLDDAVKIAMGFMYEYCEDLTEMQEIEVILRQDMEQKCYINMPFTDAEACKAILERVMDINPVEIASQIENDNLRDFCKSFQIWMQMMLMQIVRCLFGRHYLTNGGAAPCSENERPDEWAQIGLEG